MDVQVIKGYELRERIGVGGFGAVYRAFQPAVGREVAIKVILPEFANQPEFIRRFEVEAQLVAHLEDPHIVPLYDYWRDPSGAYLVMRLLRGGSVRKSLNGDPWPLEAIAKLLEQIAGALTTAHRNGVIHRDLKPDNILLDDERNAYLSDFGIAKVINPTTISNSLNLLSPAYAAPEQFKGESVTPATDVYSFGIILYELLTGSHPFPKISVAELINKTLNEPLPPLQEIRPDLPDAINGVLQIATAKSVGERYGNARQLASAFAQALKSSRGGATIHFEELAPVPTANPYKGLHAFQEADVADFFGREKLTEKIISQLAALSGSNRFLAVVGPSGSGKSSVVKAGLLPLLRQGAVPGSDQWYVAEVLPGSHPLDEVDIALTRLTATPGMNLLPLLLEDERGLIRVTRKIFPEGSHLLLVIDQFEEVFTLVENQAETLHFLESLYAAVTDPRSGIRVVITLRADFYDRPLMHPHFSELVSQHTLVVVPLTAEELERAIVRPAERQGVQFEEGLVSKIASDVHDQPGALPLLQYALTELFERRDDRRLTHDAYHVIGGLVGALAKRADELYADLNEEGQELVRQLFLRLVTLGEGVEDTRRRTTLSELRSLSPNTGLMDEIISTFANYRLLSLDNDPGTRTPTVEVAHEAILREWDRLRTWLDETRDDIKLQRQLTLLAGEWQTAQQDSSYLIRGLRLEQFEAWSKETKLALTPQEQNYLAVSLAERVKQNAEERARQERETRLERRSRNILRGLVAVLLLATLGALGLTGVAISQSNIAQVERDNAQIERDNAQTNAAFANSRELASAAVTNLGVDPQLSLLLALQAMKTTYEINGTMTREAEEALHRAVGTSQPYLILSGHAGAINDIVYSPDGTQIATASLDGTVRIWDVVTGNTTQILDEAVAESNIANTSNREIYSLAYSPDGKRIVTGSRDGMTVVWDVVTGTPLMRFYDSNPDYQVYRVAYSPDGAKVAALSTNLPFAAVISDTLPSNSDGKDHWQVTVWDLISSKVSFTFDDRKPQDVQIFGIWGGLAFSPDGNLLAVSASKDADIWDLNSDQKILTLTGHTGTILSLAFSSDGTKVITSSVDTTVKLWDIATPLSFKASFTIPALSFSAAGLSSASFGTGAFAVRPDGRWVITSSPNTLAQVWDTNTGSPLYSLSGYSGLINKLAFSPNSKTLATVSSDKIARLWDISPGREIFSIQWDNGSGAWYDYSPDGTHLVIPGGDYPSSIIDAVTGERVLTFDTPGMNVQAAAYNPNGQLVVLSGNPPSVWDATTGKQLMSLNGHAGVADVVVYSSDGKLIASGGTDQTVRIWDATTGVLIHTLTGHVGGVHCLDFSPDNIHLASGGDDRQVIIWNAIIGQKVFSVPTNANVINQVSFSPDGKRFGVSDATATATIWDSETGELLHELGGHPAALGAIDFSDDGKYIETTGGVIAKIWDAQTYKELLTLYSHTNAAMGQAFFSPDNQHIAIQEARGVSVFTLSKSELIDLAKSRVTRTLTTEECQRYLHTDTCPTEP